MNSDMQTKLNMLKRQIDKISRREAKYSKSKQSVKSKYNHGRNLSSYSFQSKPKASKKNQSISKKTSNWKNGKRKSKKSHVKSNSFAGIRHITGKRGDSIGAKKKYHQRATSGSLTDYNVEEEVKAKKRVKKYGEYSTMMKKNPVNIFNIKNYNVLKSEKSKVKVKEMSFTKKSEAHKSVHGYNGKGSPQIGDQKIHNFFVFIGNKDGGTQKMSKIHPIKYKGAGSPNTKKDSKSNYNNRKAFKKEKKYVKLTNLMKRQPLREKSRKGSIGKKSKNKSESNNLFSNEMLNFTEKIENFTRELRVMRGEDMSERDRPSLNQKRLDTEKSDYPSSRNSDVSYNSSKLKGNLSGRPLGMFIKTKQKTLDVLSELSKTVQMIKEIKPMMSETSTQTDSSSKLDNKERGTEKSTKSSKTGEFAPISFSNLNIMNLLKEVAKEILIKSNIVNPKIKNLGEFCKEINSQISNKAPEFKDPEKQVLISGILNYYQEQIIFEEALSILQDKKVDLENLFVYAYERLKIKVDDDDESKRADEAEEEDDNFTIATDASLATLSHFGEFEDNGAPVKVKPSRKDMVLKKITSGNIETNNHFELDFTKIERDEISDDED